MHRLNSEVMQNKPYKIPDIKPQVVSEPEVAYNKTVSGISFSKEWNPNLPFYGTQEEWWEHFHQIEEGHFTPLEEANKEFAIWKEKYIANRLK